MQALLKAAVPFEQPVHYIEIVKFQQAHIIVLFYQCERPSEFEFRRYCDSQACSAGKTVKVVGMGVHKLTLQTFRPCESAFANATVMLLWAVLLLPGHCLGVV